MDSSEQASDYQASTPADTGLEGSCEETDGTSSSQSSITSFLTRLGQPIPSKLARKRIIQHNPPPLVQSDTKVLYEMNPKNVQPSETMPW